MVQQRAKKPSWLDTLKSVAASMFGVQTSSNLEKDFARPSATAFIVVGVLFVIAFVLILATFVSFL